MPTKTLLVHIPVEKLEIVRSDVDPDELFLFMGMPVKPELIINVTLRVDGVRVSFKRHLKITEVTSAYVTGRRNIQSACQFKGVFAGQPVEGIYMNDRTGYIVPAQ